MTARDLLKLINTTLEADQGARFRTLLREQIVLVEDAYRGEDAPFRKHLGASIIGRECSREIWYSFHWAKVPHFPGKILRLFNRGHLEEARQIALLQMIGATVYTHDATGEQFHIIDHAGHFGGSLDGVSVHIPGIPVPVLNEFKTHNDKWFNKILRSNMPEAKFEHYVQMQIYMYKQSLQWGLYHAINKNTDELHLEWIALNSDIAESYIARAAWLIFDCATPPQRISESPAWYKCKFCSYHGVCHQGQPMARNCRTCRYAHPTNRANAEWVCEWHSTALPFEIQLIGCNDYSPL